MGAGRVAFRPLGKELAKAPTLSRAAIDILQQNASHLNQAQADHLIRTALKDKANSFHAKGDHAMAARIAEILQDGLPAEEVARVVSELSLGKAATAAAARGSALSPQGKGLHEGGKQSASDAQSPLPEAVLKPVLQKMGCKVERWGHFQQDFQEAGDEGSRETWQSIMQKRRRGVSYKEMMRDLTGLADHICREWAARRIQAAWRAWRRGLNVGDAVGRLQEPQGAAKPKDYKRLLQWALRQAAELRHKQARPDQKRLLDMMLKRLGPQYSVPNTDHDDMLDSNTQFLANNLEKLISPMTSPYQQQLRSLNLWYRPQLNLTMSMVRRVSCADRLHRNSSSCKSRNSMVSRVLSRPCSMRNTSRPTTARSHISRPASPASPKHQDSPKKGVVGFGRHVREEVRAYDRQEYVPPSALWATGLRGQHSTSRPAPLKRGQGLALVQQGRAAAALAAAQAVRAARAPVLPPKRSASRARAGAGAGSVPIPGSSTAERAARKAARAAAGAAAKAGACRKGWSDGSPSDSGSYATDSDACSGEGGRGVSAIVRGPGTAARPTLPLGCSSLSAPQTAHPGIPFGASSLSAPGLVTSPGTLGGTADSVPAPHPPHHMQPAMGYGVDGMHRPGSHAPPRKHKGSVAFGVAFAADKGRRHAGAGGVDGGLGGAAAAVAAAAGAAAALAVDPYYRSGPGAAELDALWLWLQGVAGPGPAGQEATAGEASAMASGEEAGHTGGAPLGPRSTGALPPALQPAEAGVAGTLDATACTGAARSPGPGAAGKRGGEPACAGMQAQVVQPPPQTQVQQGWSELHQVQGVQAALVQGLLHGLQALCEGRGAGAPVASMLAGGGEAWEVGRGLSGMGSAAAAATAATAAAGGAAGSTGTRRTPAIDGVWGATQELLRQRRQCQQEEQQCQQLAQQLVHGGGGLWCSADVQAVAAALQQLRSSYSSYSGKPPLPLHLLYQLLLASQAASAIPSMGCAQHAAPAGLSRAEAAAHAQHTKHHSMRHGSHAVRVAWHHRMDPLQPFHLVRRSLAEDDARAALHSLHYPHRSHHHPHVHAHHAHPPLHHLHHHPHRRPPPLARQQAAPAPGPPALAVAAPPQRSCLQHRPSAMTGHLLHSSRGSPCSSYSGSYPAAAGAGMHAGAHMSVPMHVLPPARALSHALASRAKLRPYGTVSGLRRRHPSHATLDTPAQPLEGCLDSHRGPNTAWEMVEARGMGRNPGQPGSSRLPAHPSTHPQSGHHLAQRSNAAAGQLHARLTARLRALTSYGSQSIRSRRRSSSSSSSCSSWEGEEQVWQESAAGGMSLNKEGGPHLPDAVTVIYASADRLIRRLTRQPTMRPAYGASGDRGAWAEKAASAQKRALEAVPVFDSGSGVVWTEDVEKAHTLGLEGSGSSRAAWVSKAQPKPPSLCSPAPRASTVSEALLTIGDEQACLQPCTGFKDTVQPDSREEGCAPVLAVPSSARRKRLSPPGLASSTAASLSTSRSSTGSSHSIHISCGNNPNEGVVVGCCTAPGSCSACQPVDAAPPTPFALASKPSTGTGSARALMPTNSGQGAQQPLGSAQGCRHRQRVHLSGTYFKSSSSQPMPSCAASTSTIGTLLSKPTCLHRPSLSCDGHQVLPVEVLGTNLALAQPKVQSDQLGPSSASVNAQSCESSRKSGSCSIPCRPASGTCLKPQQQQQQQQLHQPTLSPVPPSSCAPPSSTANVLTRRRKHACQESPGPASPSHPSSTLLLPVLPVTRHPPQPTSLQPPHAQLGIGNRPPLPHRPSLSSADQQLPQTLSPAVAWQNKPQPPLFLTPTEAAARSLQSAVHHHKHSLPQEELHRALAPASSNPGSHLEQQEGLLMQAHAGKLVLASHKTQHPTSTALQHSNGSRSSSSSSSSNKMDHNSSLPTRPSSNVCCHGTATLPLSAPSLQQIMQHRHQEQQRRRIVPATPSTTVSAPLLPLNLAMPP